MPEDKIKVTPAKGRPMLHWVGKRPLDYVKGFPAQLAEVFDPLNTAKNPEIPSYENLKDNWHNLLFHGDNKDVLATLLEKGFRGKIDLIYIDPPFSSNKDYVRKVELRGLKSLGKLEDGEASVLQQVMYEDMWKRDEYFQFMYERLMLLKELLSETGSIYVHMDWHVGHYIKLIMDEIFGQENFQNEIIWYYPNKIPDKRKFCFTNATDMILVYSKSGIKHKFKPQYKKVEPHKRAREVKIKGIKQSLRDDNGNVIYEIYDKRLVDNVWEIPSLAGSSHERSGFQTQKPEFLLKRIIEVSTEHDDIVLDSFIGAGTTAAVAQKRGRRWIGCDINKGAVQLTSKRLQGAILDQIKERSGRLPTGNPTPMYSTFGIYKVNDYDLKLLQTEATELAVQHIGIQRVRTDPFFDGTLGKNLVKIIDFNHPLTLLDLQLIQDEVRKRPNEDRDITIVCLGKELAADPWIDEWNKKHPVNKIHIIELKTDKKYGSFLIHKPAEAKVKIERIDKTKANVVIEDFISPAIIERLNIDNKLFKVKIPDFRCMIDTVLIDNDYNDKTFHIVYSDVPEKKNDLVKGEYEIEIPDSKTKVAVKIIDMLGEEVVVAREV